MAIEQDGGTLGRRVYRKPTHTISYLNNASFHDPVQNQGVLNTLVHEAKVVCDCKSLQGKFYGPSKWLWKRGYFQGLKRWIWKMDMKKQEDGEKRKALIPYVGAMSQNI